MSVLVGGTICELCSFGSLCCAMSVLVGGGTICGLCLFGSPSSVVRCQVGRYVGCVCLDRSDVLCDVHVGRWDDMWVVLIVGSITETHAAPDASLKTDLSCGLRPGKYQKSRK